MNKTDRADDFDVQAERLVQNLDSKALSQIEWEISEALKAAFAEGRSTTLQSCQPYLQHQKFCMMLQPSLLSAGDGPAQCSCGLAALHASDPPTEQ